MKTIVLTLVVSVTTFVSVAADAAFDCIIASDRTTYAVGQVPAITVSITNKSPKEVMLVGSLDGSDVGWRFPKCRLEILDAEGKPVTAPMFRCGNMNVLKTTDFIAVPAGKTFNPFGKGFFPPSQFYQFPVTTPGDYTLHFYYSTSDRVQDYFGDERGSQTNATPEIQRLFERVPKLELKSNTLKLKFVPKSK